MMVPILRNICEHLVAIDAAYKARLGCDDYSSRKDPFTERMTRQFVTALVIRNHLRISRSSPKHVKLYHRTLLLSAEKMGRARRHAPTRRMLKLKRFWPYRAAPHFQLRISGKSSPCSSM